MMGLAARLSANFAWFAFENARTHGVLDVAVRSSGERVRPFPLFDGGAVSSWLPSDWTF